MTQYDKFFSTAILEDLQTDEDDAAMRAVLDKDTDPNDFSADAPSVDIQKMVQDKENKMVVELESWIQQIQAFNDFLNDTNPSSIQSKLKTAAPESLFDKIRSAEQKRITRVATDLAALTEIFKGYLATSSNPQLKYV